MKYVSDRENFIEDLMLEQDPLDLVHGVDRTGIDELYKPGFES